MKKLLTDNFILKILSVFLAILIWLLVLNIEDPAKTRTITGIRVEVLNEDVVTKNNQVYSIMEGQLISVKVTGPRTVVDALTASDFRATADFKDISQADSVPINIELKKYTNQQKVTIDSISNNTIRLKIEDMVERLYDVSVKYFGALPEGYIKEGTRLETPTVTVTAPQSIQDTIKEVCVSIDLTDATADFASVYSVRITDRNGVDLSQMNDHVFVDIPNIQAETIIYYTKQLPILYETVEGLQANMEVKSIYLSKNEVGVKGKKEVLDAIENITLPTKDIVIDENEREISREFLLEECLPEGVYLYDDEESVVFTISATANIKKTITVHASDIAIKNIPEGLDASIVTTGNVNIVVEGIEEDIEKLKENEMIPFVSLKGLHEGISEVKVEVQLPEGIVMASDVSVQVNLTNTDSRQSSSQINEQTTTSEQTTATTQKPSQEGGSDSSGSQETTTYEETTGQEET